MTGGEVLKTIMSGSTTDISHISKFGWYNCIMCWDNLLAFTDKSLTMIYIGLATDVRSMLTAKIIKANFQYVCRSTLQHLTDKELNRPIHIETRHKFDESIEKCLGPGALK